MTKNKKQKTDIVVLYHNNCPDGFGAAWAAWKKFGNKAKYIGVRHNDLLPRGIVGATVYLLDLTYPLATLRKLLRRAQSVMIIDHHQSMEPVMKQAPSYIFDNAHSGAVLAWQYFHPSRSIPYLLRCIEDLDLWRRRLKDSFVVREILNTLDYDFVSWNKLVSNLDLPHKRRDSINKAQILLTYRDKIIERALKHAESVRFLGRKALAANSLVFVDEIGYALANKKPNLAIIWSYRNGELMVSLRSNGSIDVSTLARKFRGDGHKTASAFIVPGYQAFPWKPIKK